MGSWFQRRRRPTMRDLLVQQIDIALEGAEAALEAVRVRDRRADARAAISEIERRGDRARENLIRVMATRVATPLDREDLFRASRSIDDVLDNTRDFVREMSMWDADPTENCERALLQVAAALTELRSAASSTEPATVRKHCLAARKQAGHVRRAYQDGLAHLFEGELSMGTIKTRELLRRLDVVGLRLAEGVDALLDGLVKRAI